MKHGGNNADVGIPGVSKTGIPMAVCIGAVGGCQRRTGGVEHGPGKEIAERLADSGIVEVEVRWICPLTDGMELVLETEKGTVKGYRCHRLTWFIRK